MPRDRALRRLTGWLLLLVVVPAACAVAPLTRPQTVADGDAERGRTVIDDYGCGACHNVPGVPGADAYVGPPLDRFGTRAYIAGQLSNDQDNLVDWIMNPQDVEPGTAMPDLGVTRRDAVDMSAYLLSLD